MNDPSASRPLSSASSPPSGVPILRVATWNVARSGGPDRVALIADHQLDLLCAQEVTARTHAQLIASGVFDWGLHSLDHRPGPRRAGGSQRLGVAVYGRRTVRVRGAGVLNHLPRPETFLYADVDVEGWRHPLTIASYHAAPGPGKPESTLGVAHWFELQFGPAVLGLDANSPSVDHPDHERSLYCWGQAPYTLMEPALIGPPSFVRHRLRDALRLRLAAHPDEAAPLSDLGPLAVTHDRDKRHDGHSPSRFDSLWVTPEFAVGPVEHLWDHEAGRPIGGSDHAMVVTTLSPAVPPRNKREDIVVHLRRCRVLPDGATLVLNTEQVPDGDDRDLLVAWLAVDDERCRAIWHNEGPRELVWAVDGERYRVDTLARRICAAAGIAFPDTRPGPHWWLDPRQGHKSLVHISGGP